MSSEVQMVRLNGLFKKHCMRQSAPQKNKTQQMSNEFGINPEILKELFTTKMPFGKHKGLLIADLPAYYLEWFSAKGFPPGKLGMLMATVFEIKTNGLQDILFELRKRFVKN